MSNEEWDTLDDAMANKLVITDVAFVSDRKKPPQDYEVVSRLLWFVYSSTVKLDKARQPFSSHSSYPPVYNTVCFLRTGREHP